MGKKLSAEKIRDRIKKYNIELLGEYTLCTEKTLFRCFCGKEFLTKPIYITTGETKSCGCQKYSGFKIQHENIRVSKEEILLRLQEKDFEVIGHIFGIRDKVKFRCHCDKIFESTPQNIISGNTKSCGCSRYTKMSSGTKFGRLLTIEKDLNTSYLKKKTYWFCKCDCGKMRAFSVRGLLDGSISSCGCLQRELSRDRLRKFLKSRPNHNQAGVNHPAYNPNVPDSERKSRRHTVKSRIWREAVYERDNYKCVICSSKSNLCAHHLDGYHWCKEKRFDVDNGGTLCKSHHKDFHTKYGKKNNTKVQFDEYRFGL